MFLALLWAAPVRSDADPAQLAFFEMRIRPLLHDRCFECHAATSRKVRGGLLLDSKASVLKGGASGPAIIPGDAANSLLIKAVRRLDEDSAMPPKKALSSDEVSDLEKWVAMGAPDPRGEDASTPVEKVDSSKARSWWSFQPVTDAAPPVARLKRWPRNDIDRFILARIEKADLTPSLEADRRVLIRRATFDLTGLPPTPAEIDAFLADSSPDAFAKVVDRLLSSPRYGERWGRHWLDVVRYADTAGDNSDFPIPQIHKYRDWVINAFNRDLPYDDFVRHQLAGDLLPAAGKEAAREQIIATGYIANARRFGSRVDDYPQHLTIEDTIDNVGRAFLGLTVSCARCHDHKFDPISAEDYYGLYGIFHSTRYPWPGIELDQRQRDFVPLAESTVVESALKARREKQSELEAEVKRLEAEVKSAASPAKGKAEKALAGAKKALDHHKASPPPFEQAYAVAEAKKIEDVRVQLKGDPAKPGPLVRRHFLRALSGKDLPEDEKSSGRLRLADWIVDGQNPLAARVMVNRIWLQHFGRGLVPTPNDFGKQGKPPTHPELLDFLAFRFVESDWSVKSMHRLIMLSATYQLASARSSRALEQDPANELLSSFPRRRLDAESIRDTLLALGGELDLRAPGPHPFPPMSEFKFTQHNPFKAHYPTDRRSVYLMTQRIQRDPYLAIFDGADPSASTAFRTASTTPLQALFLLNDAFVHQQARRFAKRILQEPPATRVERACQFALARKPTHSEIEASARFFERIRAGLAAKRKDPAALDLESWQAYSRSLFRLNEFVYLD